MDTQCGRIERLERAVRRQRLAIGALGGGLVLLVAGGQARFASEPPAHDDPPSFRYTAGGDRLYRIHPDGRIEYLLVDFAAGSAEGIPGWAPVQIDHTLSRDRMGNEVRLRR